MSADKAVTSHRSARWSEDVIGGLGPFEGREIGIVLTDEIHNVFAQSLDTPIDAAPDISVMSAKKRSGAGWCETDMPARPLGGPIADQRGLWPCAWHTCP